MERRQIFGAAAGVLFTTGAAEVLGGLNATLHAPWLVLVGATSATVGIGIWVILFATAKKPLATITSTEPTADSTPQSEGVNVRSYDQSGGITAQTVNLGHLDEQRK